MSAARQNSPSLSARMYQPTLWLLAVLLFLGVHRAQRSLNVAREVLGLTAVTPLENAPPILAFTTVALGGFRGLIANFLWIRATDMQENEKYFEMVQLSDWITKLQPQIATVWQHLAWNMSYNISVKFNDPHDRWLWVQRGIKLLRDDGIRYNPHRTLLYHELAWHFQHKMGGYLDDAHNYYKAAWAYEMQQVLGEPKQGRTDFDELIDPSTPEATARATKLREVYKMDPAIMKRVDETYGPLEWRLPETHAIYWAIRGVEMGREVTDADRVQVRRIIYQALQLAFQRGRLIYPRAGSQRFEYRPNLEIVGQVNKSIEEMIEKEERGPYLYNDGHKNFLRQAVTMLYLSNRKELANQWLQYLDKKFPGAIPPDMDAEAYALSQFEETIADNSPPKFSAVMGILFENEFRDLAVGEMESAAQFEFFARRIHQGYMNRVGGGNIYVPGVTASNQTVRTALDFGRLKEAARDRVLDPAQGYLHPDDILALKTQLGLPADYVPATNTIPLLPEVIEGLNAEAGSTTAPPSSGQRGTNAPVGIGPAPNNSSPTNRGPPRSG